MKEEGTAATTHLLVLQPTTCSSGNWKRFFSHQPLCLLIRSHQIQPVQSILLLLLLTFTYLSFCWISPAWVSRNHVQFLFGTGCLCISFPPPYLKAAVTANMHYILMDSQITTNTREKKWLFKTEQSRIVCYFWSDKSPETAEKQWGKYFSSSCISKILLLEWINA